jgi:two-component system, OmpR family, phosphate regulon sensor histidine kinase PhoR
MKLPLRWKIAIAFTLLAAVVFLSLHAYLQRSVRENNIADLEASLLVQARLIARQLPGHLQRGAAAQALATQLDGLTQSRLTLISPDGTVLADSRDNPAAMENHANRPERLQALETGSGSALRFSETLRIDMLYVAVSSSSTPGLVVRLAQPLTDVRAHMQHVQHVTLAAFIVAVAAVWLLSMLMAASLTAPLEALVRVARRVDRGDLQARVEQLREPELAELASTFNAALDSLSTLLETSRRESRYYAAILQQMTDAVVVVDSQGRVQFVNAAFAELFDIDEQAVQGKSSEEIALSYELSSLLARAVEQGAAQHDEVRVLTPEPRTLAAAVTPLHDADGQTTGAVGLLHDVTSLRRYDEIRREFVANASHELRTPAGSIKALAEALQVGAMRDPEKGPRFVEQIVESADRLTSILDDMLILTRVERGRQLLKPEPVGVLQAMQDAAEQLRIKSEGKGINVQLDAAPEDTLVVDPSGLHTVLLNLTDNAIKYTPEGGSVRLQGHGVPGGYEISVTDTGMGIPPEHHARIFERFYRVDKARDRATGGTGLGLAIVKHTVEAHNGRVTVKSAPEQGSTFTVFFPAGTSNGSSGS